MANLSERPINTRLELFMRKNQIIPVRLAEETGYSRQHLLRVRVGRMEPTLSCISAILQAVRRLKKDARIRADDLFDFDQPAAAGQRRKVPVRMWPTRRTERA